MHASSWTWPRFSQPPHQFFRNLLWPLFGEGLLSRFSSGQTFASIMTAKHRLHHCVHHQHAFHPRSLILSDHWTILVIRFSASGFFPSTGCMEMAPDIPSIGASVFPKWVISRFLGRSSEYLFLSDTQRVLDENDSSKEQKQMWIW